MRDVLSEIERALKARGWSARYASELAVSNPDLIRNIRRGQVPSVERLRALCEVLGLEFYVGAPRDAQTLDERRLELAVETAERALAAGGHKLSHAEKARFLAGVYALIGEEQASVNARRISQLITMVSRPGRARERANARGREDGPRD